VTAYLRQPVSTIDDVGVFAIATGFSICAQRYDVECMSRTLARGAVCEGASPRIVNSTCVLGVGTVPASNAGRSRIQRRQPLLSRRIAADIESIQVENAREPLDRLIRDSVFCGTKLPDHRRPYQAYKKSENRQDHKQFDERETALLLISRERRRICPHRERTRGKTKHSKSRNEIAHLHGDVAERRRPNRSVLHSP
jgi:hypothetical protein